MNQSWLELVRFRAQHRSIMWTKQCTLISYPDRKSLTSSLTSVPAHLISFPGISTCQGNSLWLAFLLSGLYIFEKYGIEFRRRFICRDLFEIRSHFLSWLLLNRIVKWTIGRGDTMILIKKNLTWIFLKNAPTWSQGSTE